LTEYILDDRYTLAERIATGGMGEVWRGVDHLLGRPVAVKLLSAAHAGDEQFRARFRAEARYAASLNHPGIARVFDYGEVSPLGGPYLVMELVDGEPLSAILERVGRLSPDMTLDIIGQAASALDAAHQAGIVHRDIKPGNLLIMADGTTKITDFGIAKARSAAELNLTATGIVMGTALYVSPEQATGSALSGASDIYSLGVVAYECLTGQPPFVADQPLAVAIMHRHDPVPPLPPDVPRAVSDLVLAMLAKTPEGRPESARHVADRAGVIRDALAGSGADRPNTPDAPTTFDYSPTAGTFLDGPDRVADTRLDDSEWAADPHFDDPGRTAGPRPGRQRLAVAGVGVGAAVLGVGAIVTVLVGGIVALLLASGSHPPAAQAGSATSPAQSQPATHARSRTAGPAHTTGADGTGPGTNSGPTPTTAAHSTRPASGRKSPTAKPDTSATRGTKPTSPPSSPPTSPPSSPPTSPPTSPTTSPPTSPPSSPPTSPPSSSPARG
jgi:serine/threonine protein kinase